MYDFIQTFSTSHLALQFYEKQVIQHPPPLTWEELLRWYDVRNEKAEASPDNDDVRDDELGDLNKLFSKLNI